MEKRMIDFMEGQKVATVCCVDMDNKPYCFSCFYVFDKARQLFYFKSSANTHHARLFMEKPFVSGTIQPDKLNPLAIKGVQFSGTVLRLGDKRCEDAAPVYHKKYPFALAMPGDIWAIKPAYIKMTDNTLGFGKKISWQADELAMMNPA